MESVLEMTRVNVTGHRALCTRVAIDHVTRSAVLSTPCGLNVGLLAVLAHGEVVLEVPIVLWLGRDPI